MQSELHETRRRHEEKTFPSVQYASSLESVCIAILRTLRKEYREFFLFFTGIRKKEISLVEI